jgi:hypothetical protein
LDAGGIAKCLTPEEQVRVACTLPHPDQDPKKLDAAPPDFWHALEYEIGNEASVIDEARGSLVDKYRQMAE